MSLTPQTAANCYHCHYEWWSRVKEPKACPKCKGRLDTTKKKEVQSDSFKNHSLVVSIARKAADDVA
jgi:ssDNA-binding Zn-finger/Zn-ribbon topoisomerase 1